MNNEINELTAYQMGRVDALTGEPPNRFTGKPYSGPLPVPDGYCACSGGEAENWAEIRQQYLAGYESQSSRIEQPARLKS